MKRIYAIIITVILFAFALTITYATDEIEVNRDFGFEEFVHEGTIMPYRIYVPEDYDEETEYPLVVFLHGAGERGKDNDLQLKNAVQTLFDRDDGLMKQSIVIAPQCNTDNQWVDTPWANGNYSVDQIPESDELGAVVALTESIAGKYSIDKTRIYAMGVSMGGFGTWDLIIRHNDVFAAAAPMCGGGDPSKASLLVNTPIYTFHGTADKSVPYSGTAEMVRAIEDEGSRVINFVSYDGDGHNIWEKAAAEPDWLAWLFEQRLTDRYAETMDTEETSAPESTPISESETADITSIDTAINNAPESGENSIEKPEDDSVFPAWGIALIIAVVITNVIVIIAIIAKKKK